MGLKKRINELKALDFAYASWCSELRNHGNLRSLGYEAPFHEPYIKPKAPDLLLINKNRGFVLVVEVKSGRVQREDSEQASGYADLGLRRLEGECRKILRDRRFELKDYDLVFQFYKNMLEAADPALIERISEYANVVGAEPGGLFQVYKINAFVDEELKQLLVQGIPLPDNPQPMFFLTNNADHSLFAHAVIRHGLSYVTVQKSNFDLTFAQIITDIRKHYRIPRQLIRETLGMLESIGILGKIKAKTDSGVMPQYRFFKGALTRQGFSTIDDMMSCQRIQDIAAPGTAGLEAFG